MSDCEEQLQSTVGPSHNVIGLGGFQAIKLRCKRSEDKRGDNPNQANRPIISPNYFFMYTAHKNLGHFEIVYRDAS